MNLTGRPPYQKGQKLHRQRARQANAAERRHWEKVRALGCIIAGGHARECWGRITINHCGTGAGGRKNHMKVIPLCYSHHLGPKGIDGGVLSKKKWQQHYGTEDQLLAEVKVKLEKNRGE